MQNDQSPNQSSQKLLSIGEAAEYLGVSIDKLRRWEKKKKIEALRSPGGHRYYHKDNLDELFGRKYERAPETKPRNIVEKNIVEEVVSQNPPPVVIEEVDISTSFHEFSRPSRPVEIPTIAPVRIITSTPNYNSPPTDVSVSTETVTKGAVDQSRMEGVKNEEIKRESIITETIKTSILNPTLEEQSHSQIEEIQKNTVQESIPSNKKSLSKTWIIIVSSTVVIILLGGLAIYFWNASKVILSPVP